MINVNQAGSYDITSSLPRWLKIKICSKICDKIVEERHSRDKQAQNCPKMDLALQLSNQYPNSLSKFKMAA